MNGYASTNPIKINQTMRILRFCVWALLSCLSAMLVGCSGGGDISEIVEQTPLPDGSENVGTSLNGGLTGRIVTARNDLPFEFDLATGASRFIPLTTIQQSLATTEEDFDGDVRIGYFTGRNGAGFVQAGTQCHFIPLQTAELFRFESCLAVYDENFERTNYIRLRNTEIEGAIKISPSGRYVAYSEDFGVSDTTSVIIILELSTLENVAEFRQSEPNFFGPLFAPVFAWGPADEFVFSGVRVEDERLQVQIAQPETFDIVNSITLPAGFESRMRSFDLSPDGSQLLFQVDSSMFLMDMNTLIFTTPVSAELGELSSPRFSPDGQWFMVFHEIATPAPVFDINLQATVFPSTRSLYAIPVNAAEPPVIGGDQLGEAVLIQSDQENNPGTLSTVFPGDATLDVPFFDWLP